VDDTECGISLSVEVDLIHCIAIGGRFLWTRLCIYRRRFTYCWVLATQKRHCSMEPPHFIKRKITSSSSCCSFF